MTVETMIYQALKGLVNNRVYRMIAPQTITELPRITFQQVGGLSRTFLDQGVPSKTNGRFQITCWDDRYDDVLALARQANQTMRAYAPLQATPLGEPIAIYEEDTELYGAIQDYNVEFDT